MYFHGGKGGWVPTRKEEDNDCLPISIACLLWWEFPTSEEIVSEALVAVCLINGWCYENYLYLEEGFVDLHNIRFQVLKDGLVGLETSTRSPEIISISTSTTHHCFKKTDSPYQKKKKKTDSHYLIIVYHLSQ